MATDGEWDEPGLAFLRAELALSPQIWSAFIRTDPEFLAAAEALYRYPLERAALRPAIRAVVCVSLEAAVTQLDQERLKIRIDEALEAGCTEDDIVCVLELTHLIGQHSITAAVPILREELARRSLQPEVALTERQARLTEEFERGGPRSRTLEGYYDTLLRLDPEYFERRMRLIEVPWTRSQVLDEQTKHLVCIAIDAVCSHLFESGMRRHIGDALDVGVRPEEIMEVLQLASAVGLRTLAAGFRLLIEASR